MGRSLGVQGLPAFSDKMKLNFKSYYEPTPKNLRKFADALLALSLFVTGYSVIMEFKILALVFIIIGAIGKFGTNFFAEE